MWHSTRANTNTQRQTGKSILDRKELIKNSNNFHLTTKAHLLQHTDALVLWVLITLSIFSGWLGPLNVVLGKMNVFHETGCSKLAISLQSSAQNL